RGCPSNSRGAANGRPLSAATPTSTCSPPSAARSATNCCAGSADATRGCGSVRPAPLSNYLIDIEILRPPPPRGAAAALPMLTFVLYMFSWNMDGDTLLNSPYVIVRLACRYCARVGAYRLVRLAVKFGCEAKVSDVVVKLATDCPHWRPNKRWPEG